MALMLALMVLGLLAGPAVGLRSGLRMSSTTAPAAVANAAAPAGSKTFFIETHGCQMNLADSDVVRSVLQSAGYYPSSELEHADLILTNTCAIRENAEAKVYHRLKYFNSLRKKNRKTGEKPEGYPLVGLLGCMAERLKTKLLDDKALNINFIAGPDSYRELPNLLMAASTDQRAASTQLSLDETYADIAPVRLAEGNTHAFVTIQRGCSNFCSFCIVPFTRGRERSRAAASIVAEVCVLREQGYKEVVLLGQNVNSYNYREGVEAEGEGEGEEQGKEEQAAAEGRLAPGFAQRSRPRTVGVAAGAGVDFGELLQQVAAVDPEMRVRFQAPHPKDFPDDVLKLIGATPNVCRSLHMPAQHGSSTTLERMRRGYSRDAYVSLVTRARVLLGRGSPEGVGMGLSSDFISGFCGETEAEHEENLSLVRDVGFDQAFTYSYSRREQTYAGLFLPDDVPEPTKARRLSELVDAFQTSVQARNQRLEIGRLHVVLVEGEGKKGPGSWSGRTDSNKRVVFADSAALLDGLGADEAAALALAPSAPDAVAQRLEAALQLRRQQSQPGRAPVAVSKGSCVIVKILSARGHTLRGVPLAVTTLQQSFALNLPALPTAADSA